MELPKEISDLLYTKLDNVKSTYLSSIFEKLSKDYTQNTGTEKEFLPNKDYVLVYALSRMNATFNVVDYVLNKFCEYIDFDVKSLLDVGGGMGTASINSLYHFELEHIDILEKNEFMINLGKEIQSLYDQKFEYIKQNALNFSIQKKYDMVIASYFLNELSERNFEKALNLLWNHSQNYIVICDVGTPKGYQNLLKMKEYFLNKGGKILLPCPNNVCPLQNDWCHFVTRVSRNKIQKLVKNADSPFEDEKFCYLVVAKQGDNLLSNVVIRHPIKEKNVVKVKLCEKNKISEKDITKNNVLYKKARKIKIGDELI